MTESTTRLVLSILGGIILVSLIGIVWLAVENRAIPDILPMICSMGVTGMIGLLVPTPSKSP